MGRLAFSVFGVVFPQERSMLCVPEKRKESFRHCAELPDIHRQGRYRMLTLDALREYGANVDEGLGRCMNNEAFYLKLIGMMLEDKNFGALKDALEAHDLDAAFSCAHAVKGVAANLALTPVFGPVSEMTELGYLDGVADDYFRPNDPITRADVVRISKQIQCDRLVARGSQKKRLQAKPSSSMAVSSRVIEAWARSKQWSTARRIATSREA